MNNDGLTTSNQRSNDNYVALEDYVFVKEQKRTRTVGMMEIPDGIDMDYTFGTVVSVGPGTYENGKFHVPNVVPGDEVVFPRTVGSKINFVNNQELISVRACDLLAKKLVD